jgi:hypothetical protein
VTGVLLFGYLSGWVLTSIAVAIGGRRLRHDQAPPTHPGWMSILAGAVWPVLVVAIVEVGAVALTTETLHDDELLLTANA